MKRLVILTSALMFASPAFSQTSTATGTGVGVSRSTSKSTAVAFGGGAGGSSTSTVTLNAGNPATQTINNTGTTTIRNVPTEFAPGLAAAGLETCLGSVSGGGAFVGTGFSFGTTIPDPGCAARLDARTLWSMGLKKAAVARLCLNSDIYRAMPEVCVTYLPVQPPPGFASYAETVPPRGPVEVIVAKTGEHRYCDDYDEVKRRCRVWTH